MRPRKKERVTCKVNARPISAKGVSRSGRVKSTRLRLHPRPQADAENALRRLLRRNSNNLRALAELTPDGSDYLFQ